ncbi:MAG: UDP-N-acetylenolpyruvoylglucosamine reductase [Firmicutes bacterium]|nr:UDP-N-acetylenolpyruvoylglucosamine reductase [Bacillota bacterium]
MQNVKNVTNDDLLEKLQIAIDPKRLFVNEPMAKHTTFKIGGPADFLVFPASVDEVAAVFKIAKEYGVPVMALGNGSNILVRDKGIRAIVVKFSEALGEIRQDGQTIIAGAGATLTDVSRFAAKCGFTGMEFAIGIPGSIGGAVFMNAGAYDGEMSRVVSAVTAVRQDGRIERFEGEAIQFGYRNSVFQQNSSIVCEVEMSLISGNAEAVKAKMSEYTVSREAKQPLEMPSAGSTFKRPPGYYAGTLIEQSGLKGYSVGGAQVSEKHAGFVINAGNATAADVLALISEIQRRVFEKFGVELHPEVRIIGEE